MLSYIFISYEYSKNRTRMLENNVHGNFDLKKFIRFPCFIFKSMQEFLLGGFLSHRHPWGNQLLLESRSFCSSEQRQGQKHPALYLRSCDRVPWILLLQSDLVPSWFLKIRPSRVSAGYPSPFTADPAFFTVVPQHGLWQNHNCSPRAFLLCTLMAAELKKKKKEKCKCQKSRLLLTGMGMNRVIVQSTVVALAPSHRAQSLPRRVSAGEL